MKKFLRVRHEQILAVLTTGFLVCVTTAQAQTSSQDVFERIKKNSENATLNRDDAKKNLGVVDGNLSALAQTRQSVIADQKKLKGEMEINAQSLSQIEKNLGQFDKAVATEQKLMQNEERKIGELQAHIVKLQAQIEKRKAAMQALADSKKDLESQREQWRGREAELKKLQAEVNGKDLKLSAEEKEWKAKRSKYDKDISRWNRALEEQAKLEKNLTAMKVKQETSGAQSQ